jgi:hypothetical protein
MLLYYANDVAAASGMSLPAAGMVLAYHLCADFRAERGNPHTSEVQSTAVPELTESP